MIHCGSNPILDQAIITYRRYDRSQFVKHKLGLLINFELQPHVTRSKKSGCECGGIYSISESCHHGKLFAEGSKLQSRSKPHAIFRIKHHSMLQGTAHWPGMSRSASKTPQ